MVAYTIWLARCQATISPHASEPLCPTARRTLLFSIWPLHNSVGILSSGFERYRNFSRESYRDNIAIFHLMTPLVGVPVATLEQQQVEHVGEQALVAGWGAADSECKVRPKPSVLKEGDKQIASSRPCYLQTLLGRGKGPFEPGRHICTQEIQSGSAGVEG